MTRRDSTRDSSMDRLVAERRKRVPPGQKLTEKFPVLDLGVRPAFHDKRWRFCVDGEVEAPLLVDWQGFLALAPLRRQTSDFHCVTTWSRLDLAWAGIPFRVLAEIVTQLWDGREDEVRPVRSGQVKGQ